MMRNHVFLLLAVTACSRAPAEPPSTTANSTATANSTGTSTATANSTGTSNSTANSTGTSTPTSTSTPKPELALLWNDPPMFLRGTPKNRARAAEYVVPRVGQDSEDAECVVTTFGPGRGGTVDDNVKRWVDQFNPVIPTPRRVNMEVNGMHTAFMEIAGTYTGNMLPSRQVPGMSASKPNWRLLGAIVDAPSGIWFFKLTGPDLTVRAGAHQFEDMVRSARPR